MIQIERDPAPRERRAILAGSDEIRRLAPGASR